MGPLSVAVEADSKTFQLYKKGVIKGKFPITYGPLYLARVSRYASFLQEIAGSS